MGVISYLPEIEKLRIAANRQLTSIYDEENFTATQMSGMACAKVNEIITVINGICNYFNLIKDDLPGEIDAAISDMLQSMEYVDSSFTHTGKGADAAAVGVKFNEVIKLFNQYATVKALETLNNRVNTLETLPEGSTTADAELLDIRNGVNGVYDTAGEAVRGQITDILNLIYNGRPDDNTEVKTPVKFTGTAVSLDDIPDNSWLVAPGADLQPLLGDTFPGALGATRTYIISRCNWFDNGTHPVFTITSISGLEYYIGYRTAATGVYKWNSIYNREITPRFDNFCYSDLGTVSGWWGVNGTFDGTSRRSTKHIPIKAGKPYYIGVWFNQDETTSDVTCAGAFFDVNDNWIAPLLTADITPIEYAIGNMNESGTHTYAPVYTFTAPANAAYVSLNRSEGVANTYRQFIASSPVFMYTGGEKENIGWNDNDPICQKFRSKKVCVIGASGVAYNRMEVTINNRSQFLCGWQEYLLPFVDSVTTYGYPDISYMGIYNAVHALDFSGFDIFIFMPSTNDITLDNMGAYNSIDVNTHFGALGALIQKAYAENPHALIYVANVMHKGSYGSNDGTREKVDRMNEVYAEFTACHGVELVDLMRGAGVNQYNSAQGIMTYDTHGHLNHDGNKRTGLYFRKHIIGI